MNFGEFLQRVAERWGRSTGDAERMARATLVTLGERLTHEEAHDLASELPAPARDWVVGPSGTPEPFGAAEFVHRVATRARVDESSAVAGIRAVFATLAEAVSPGEMGDVVAELSRDFDAHLTRSSSATPRRGTCSRP